MAQGGFAGRVLHVDLTSREITTQPLDYDLAKKYIGGLGLTIKLASDTIIPGTEPLSPDNPIIMGAGPLVGTNLPAVSRVHAVTKLPSSGTVGWCGGGGVTFGSSFKNAGYDHIIIKGRASDPVYLQIIDDQVEIVDAGFLWGQGVEETCHSLWDRLGRPLGVVSIGQAGENLVSYSMAFIDRMSTMGRGGFGAVMGSKNLKAIVARGNRGIKVADRQRYKDLNGEFLKKIREYPYLAEWQELGLAKSLPIPPDQYMKIKKRRVACVSCPIGDKDVIQIPDGDLEGLIKCSPSVVNLFNPMGHGFKDIREAIKCIATLDEYGLDMFEFFGVMEFAKVLSEEGILPKDLNEPVIDPGSLDSMEAWAEKISTRQGLGDVMADGYESMARYFGDRAEEFAPPLVKGMLPYQGPKGNKGFNLFGTMELGQVLDPRGPHVGASGSPTYYAKRPIEVFPRHLNRMGVPEEALERILPGFGLPDKEPGLKVGRLLKYSHAWFSILSSLGICARAQINRFYNAEFCANIYETVTGFETSLDQLRKRVDRVWTLLRMINIREGIDLRSEQPPEKWFGESGFQDYMTAELVTPDEMDLMIKDYYQEWGWDPDTGKPGRERLAELGLLDE